jgi:hypothetical protein
MEADRLGADSARTNSEDEDVPWDVPELIATIVLVAVGVIAVGGLIGALVFVNSDEGPGGFSSQTTWNAVERGASWSSPLIAMILLGVIGTMWIQTRSRVGASSTQHEVAQFSAYVRRTLRIAGWTVAGLVLSLLGAAADFASTIGFYWSYNSVSFAASIAIPVGASAIAVLLLAVAGIWTYIRTRRLALSVPPGVGGTA